MTFPCRSSFHRPSLEAQTPADLQWSKSLFLSAEFQMYRSHRKNQAPTAIAFAGIRPSFTSPRWNILPVGVG
ncbi:hypothetical protein BAUCODRAFT_33004 [Baudoinia panamericana UAMH 10762]|uniref:Uncharacterized protein n=1 Tax=Baudoinia panamericana (strain UAMH 10762) TaxID=717646 RepID=M2NE77_BAUPA|nr:uncharacterized protein BAUCODRAFT_33004 [Baudoinia panamericana UAMH 10762]EMC97260.1 hypothetical protein BAUCODRAFT_33004 [Baudoinia panamericana UAMH 10762]